MIIFTAGREIIKRTPFLIDENFITVRKINIMRKRVPASFLCFVTIFLSIFLQSLAVKAQDMYVYFGSHSAGPGKGFSLSHFNVESGALTKPEFLIEAKEPAYFVIHRDSKHLYACNSGSPGELSAYAIDSATGQLKLLNQKPAGGSDPSYISIDKTGRYALAANYSGGNICVYEIQPDGSFGARTAFVQQTGKSVDLQRQTHAYAHSIIVDPSNRFVLVADLGVDKIFIYKFNEKDGSLSPNDTPFVTVKPGSGPRHVKFHPNGKWVYLINEMNSSINSYMWDGSKGTLKEFQNISTLPKDFTGANTCAELEVHPNGKFLYGSNRGHNSIAVFSINQTTGQLTLIQHIATGGNTPRNFAFDPTEKWIICTNQKSNNAVVFGVDGATGYLTQIGEPVEIPAPFCERFLPVTSK
jgi:6-phosphogluconolactonase